MPPTCRMCDENIRLNEYGFWVHTSNNEEHCPNHPASIAIPDDGSR